MSNNKATITSLSVIMPAYNEEESIAAAVEDVELHILNKIPNSELVVVNDGSKDSTGTILDKIAEKNPCVHVIHQVNGGHGPAIMTGLDNSSGKYVFLIDSDRQIPLDNFEELWGYIQEGYNGVFGVRRQRHDPIIRLWLTRVIRLSLTLLFGLKIYDANIPFKLFQCSIWEEAKSLMTPDTLAPSLFLALFVKKKGYKIKDIDIPHQQRATGEVSIKRMKLLKFCIKAFRQMWTFRRALRHL